MHMMSHPQQVCSQWERFYGVTMQGRVLISFCHLFADGDEDDLDDFDAPQTFGGLCRLSGLSCLQRLDISYVPVSVAGWWALAALPSLKDLTVVDMRMGTLRGEQPPVPGTSGTGCTPFKVCGAEICGLAVQTLKTNF
jgi:hypothetical protein